MQMAKKKVKNIYDTFERKTNKYIVVEMEEHTNQCIKEAIDNLEE